ncbi:3'-5' exonuclease [Vibrio casei]|uniref:3'-5' exonuclease n=1 Tax=Vibrio casei TaxID=673372 RepID=UPI000B5C854D|nr:3'-5' exonuclease [Vibrio casei]
MTNGEILKLTDEAKTLAKRFIETDVVVLDCETTDFNGHVIELALVSLRTGKTLFDSRIFSDEPISEGAFKVHGLSNQDLVGCPTISEVAETLSRIMKGKQWTAYNIEFDYEALLRSMTKAEVKAENMQWLKNKAPYVMYNLAVPYFGPSNRHGSTGLQTCLKKAGLEMRSGKAHSAIGDAIATHDIIHYISNH